MPSATMSTTTATTSAPMSALLLLVVIGVMILLLLLLLLVVRDVGCILSRLNILVHNLMMSLNLAQVVLAALR